MTRELRRRVPGRIIRRGTRWEFRRDRLMHRRRYRPNSDPVRGPSPAVEATKSITARAQEASVHDPYKAHVKWFTGLAALLVLTLAVQQYALHAGSHLHPATGVLVLYFTTWIGVAGLASTILVLVCHIALRRDRF